MKISFDTMDDKLLLFLLNLQDSLYELVSCEDLDKLDFYSFDTLERLGHLINYKTKLIKKYIKNKKNKLEEELKLKEFSALVIAHYDFTDSKGKKVHTSKLLVSLGEFGSTEVCSELANECELLSVVKVQLGYKRNKFVINSIS